MHLELWFHIVENRIKSREI